MKKIILLSILATSVSLAGMAQGIGIKGGVNMANITNSNSGNTNDNNMLTTFNAGIVLDVPLANGFSIQPQLNLEGKGSKVQSGNEGDANYYKATTNPIYLQLPIDFVGKIPLGTKGANIFLGAGPYAAMGVGGKNKVEGSALGVSGSSTSDIHFSKDDPTTSQEEGGQYGYYKKYDYGANFLGGLQLSNGLFIEANYELGLVKLNSNTSQANSDNDKFKSRVFGISIGYMFGWGSR